MSSPPFFGKYRGVVTDNDDPLIMGRIKARVPDVLGDKESGWAMACTPFAGSATGFFALPSVGAGVWVEFEQGDPDYPIWAGCWWGTATDVPSEAFPEPTQKVVLKTAGGQSIVLDDTPGTGGIFLTTSFGPKISVTSTAIEIDNGNGGTIKMQGPKVTINDGALEVLV